MILHARTLVLCLFLFAFGTIVNGQDQSKDNSPRASYEITLQLLISSDAGQKLPSNLNAVEKKLRTDFGQANYAVAMTLLNRVTEKGMLDTKGVSPFVQNQDNSKSFNFYDLNLYGLKSAGNEMLIDKLRFGLQIPLYIPTLAGEGKTAAVVQYQNLGITAQPLSVSFNEPTIIGTLTTSRPDELLVLVLTVKPDNSKQTAQKK